MGYFVFNLTKTVNLTKRKENGSKHTLQRMMELNRLHYAIKYLICAFR